MGKFQYKLKQIKKNINGIVGVVENSFDNVPR